MYGNWINHLIRLTRLRPANFLVCSRVLLLIIQVRLQGNLIGYFGQISGDGGSVFGLG